MLAAHPIYTLPLAAHRPLDARRSPMYTRPYTGAVGGYLKFVGAYYLRPRLLSVDNFCPTKKDSKKVHSLFAFKITF